MPGAEDQSAHAPAAAFAKKERRGNFRKKEKKAEDEDDGQDQSVSQLIEQTRMEQKLRGSLLDSQFSSGEVEETAYGALEKEMVKFIDKRLKGDKADEKEEAPLTEEDQLYVVPEDMKVKARPESLENNGAETWLTGIVEVELPTDAKLRNIEETAQAKQKLLDERARGVSSRIFTVDTTSDKGYVRSDSRKMLNKGHRSNAQVEERRRAADKERLARLNNPAGTASQGGPKRMRA